jgi:NADPH:quinone reductase-like Zn-dependent oxidoreductase
MNLGAAGGANYNDPNWTREIMRLCDGVGPDIVLDGAGGSSFEKALEITRPGGKVISYGATTGAANQVEVRRIFWKQLNVLGSTMGTAEEFEAMLILVDRHGLIPVIDQILPLDQAADAHRRVERTEQFGKIVLQI